MDNSQQKVLKGGSPTRGDIIRFSSLNSDDHFRIYIGKGKVIHWTFPRGGSKSTGDEPEVRKDMLWDITGDHGTAQIFNFFDEEHTPYLPAQIVKRAKEKPDQLGDLREHFVTWCRYGLEFSLHLKWIKRGIDAAQGPPNDLIRDVDLPKEGDIIRFPRKTYYHFGIYIGEGKYIHLTSAGGRIKAMAGKGEVREDNLEDLSGCKRTPRIDNLMDEKKKPHSPEEIVETARSQLGPFKYNVFVRNCEHFATWCRYGKSVSQQVERVMQMRPPISRQLRTGPNIPCSSKIVIL